MEIIGKKVNGLTHEFVAGLYKDRVGIHAKTIFEAKQKATEHFRPKKKDAGLLFVVLAEKPLSTAAL